MKKLLIEEHILAAILLIMLAILFLNVVGRYVFNWSIAFTEEVVVYLFVAASIIGAPAACARGANMGLNALTDLCPKGVQKVTCVISCAASILLFLFLFYQGLQDMTSLFRTKQLTPLLKMPVWIFIAFFPIGSGFYIFRVAQTTVYKLRELSR